MMAKTEAYIQFLLSVGVDRTAAGGSSFRIAWGVGEAAIFGGAGVAAACVCNVEDVESVFFQLAFFFMISTSDTTFRKE